MTIVHDVIAAELATLARATAAPVGPLGYGRDLSCVSDLANDLAEVDPASPVAIVEACLRRLTCPRGGLIDDPDYGLDLRAYCNRGVTITELRALDGAIRTELKKDDRVSDVDAAVSTTTLTDAALRVTVRITAADPDLEPFAFVFAVTDASALLESISNANA
jgi:hypothetical protein